MRCGGAGDWTCKTAAPRSAMLQPTRLSVERRLRCWRVLSIILQQARLEFGELQDVLQAQFVRGDSAQPLSIEPPTE